jgi:Phage integrase SAM-like domain
MSTEILQNGSQIAAEPRSSSKNDAGESVPTTLAGLLAIWAQNQPREAAMLGTTCMRLADYHNLSLNNLTIDAVDLKRNGFRAFLRHRKYRENSIRTYVNHVRILIDHAKAAGWQPDIGSSPEWRQVIQLADDQNCGNLARHLLTVRNDPRQVTSDDVNKWVLTTARFASYKANSHKATRFWRILRIAVM